MQPRVLITGVTGHTGRHLASLLAAGDCNVLGMSSQEPAAPQAGIQEGHLRLERCDIRDAGRLKRIVAEFSPQFVFHLAAVTSGRDEEHRSREVFEINVFGTNNLLDAVRAANCDPVVLVAGSSAQFGKVRDPDQPTGEGEEYRPVTPYAVSKVAQAMTATQYWLAHGVRVIRTNTFNVFGPGQGVNLVPGAFAAQLAAIERGETAPVLRVGNLSSKRDFTDVRDVAGAYWLLARRGQPGEVYNICSGQCLSIDTLLRELLALSPANVEVARAQPRNLATDVPQQTGDHTKLTAATGWQPEIPMRKTLEDTLNEWRERGKPSGARRG